MRAQAGTALIETVLAAAIVALAIAAGVAGAQATHPYGVRSAVLQFSALVDAARELGAAGGDGATLYVQSDGAGGFRAGLYAHRPIPGTGASSVAVQRMSSPVSFELHSNGSVVAPPLALFLSSSGSISAAAWQPGTVLAAEPPCSEPLQLRFGAETHAIDCADARLR